MQSNFGSLPRWFWFQASVPLPRCAGWLILSPAFHSCTRWCWEEVQHWFHTPGLMISQLGCSPPQESLHCCPWYWEELKGNGHKKIFTSYPKVHILCTQSGCGLTEYCQVDVSISLSCCIHGHTAVLSSIGNFGFHNLKCTTTSKQSRKRHSGLW